MSSLLPLELFVAAEVPGGTGAASARARRVRQSARVLARKKNVECSSSTVLDPPRLATCNTIPSGFRI